MSKLWINCDDKKNGEIVLTDKLSEDLSCLYLSPEYADVYFLVDNEKLPGHKVILAARCEYFRALLYGGFPESQQSEIILKIPLIAFKAILKYIYSGSIHLKQMKDSLILETLGLSNLFGFNELKEEISNYLKISLSLTNVCRILDSSRLYELFTLTNICYNYMDKNSEELLKHESFKYLHKDSIIHLLQRDSFFAQEISIFEAVKDWIECNTEINSKDVVSHVRLPLMSLEDILGTVRPTKILDANHLLDAIALKTNCKSLPYRGQLYVDENVATLKFGAKVIQGIHSDGNSLLEPSDNSYDLEKGYTRHSIKNEEGDGIVVQLGSIFIINHIKILLWDRDTRRYSYYIEISVEQNRWERVVDHSHYACRSMQYLYFPQRPVRFIRLVGTHNSVNRIFHVVSLEAYYSSYQPTLVNGLVAPKYNAATVDKSAVVLQGVSRKQNSLLNGDCKSYDWDKGYTCHQIGSGEILIQLGQPYHIGCMKILLWDCDERSYRFYIETSTNEKDFNMVIDKRKEQLKSWQTFNFDPKPVNFIRIVGTENTANEIFHLVHFECSAAEDVSTSSASSVVSTVN